MTASFASEQDLREFVGGIFDQALADPDLGPKLVGTGVVLKVVTTDPDGVLMLDLPERRVYLGNVDDAADATMRMTSDVANRFWQGKVNMPVAMARGQVQVEGTIGALLKLVPSTKKLFPAYLELLRSSGRTDLVAD